MLRGAGDVVIVLIFIAFVLLFGTVGLNSRSSAKNKKAYKYSLPWIFETPPPFSIDFAKAINTYYRITYGKDLANYIIGEIYMDVAKYSTKYLVPKMVVLGIIARESSFNPNAVNGTTMGLMQVTPKTAKWISDIYHFKYEYPPSIDSSIHMGIAYLHWLYNMYGSWELAIKHYYGGTNMDSYYHSVISCVEKLREYGS